MYIIPGMPGDGICFVLADPNAGLLRKPYDHKIVIGSFIYLIEIYILPYICFNNNLKTNIQWWSICHRYIPLWSF